MFNTSFAAVPTKKVICGQRSNVKLWNFFRSQSETFTVCRSLLNNIRAAKPARMAKGIKLTRARSFPTKSPENLKSVKNGNTQK